MLTNTSWKMTKENQEAFNSMFKHEILNDGDDGIQYNEYQRAPYIEDGLFIRVYNTHFELWEIPQYGGEPEKLKSNADINPIIEFARQVT